MRFCEISGFPIPDIRPREFWLHVLDKDTERWMAASVHKSMDLALDAGFARGLPAEEFYVEEVC